MSYPHVFLDIDNLLTIQNCYEQREKLAYIGARWDAHSRAFKIVFSDETLEKVLDVLPKECTVDPSLEQALIDYQARLVRLEEIRLLTQTGSIVDLVVPNLKIDPFNYQKVGIRFMTEGNGGVLLGDQMGTGKSLMSIATALLLKSQGKISHCLCIVPASLKWNWVLEIEKFTNETYTVIDGNRYQRLKSWLTDSFFTIVNYDLLLEDLFGGKDCKIKACDSEEQKLKKAERKLKNSVRQRLLEGVRDKLHDMIIFDECHYLKNWTSRRSVSCRSLRAKYRILGSGSPLDGRLEELYSIMSIVSPGLLGSRQAFFENHVKTGFHKYQVVGYKNVDVVRRAIQPFFIRRMKKDVLKELPDKIFTNRFLDLSKEEMSLYNAIKDGKHPLTKDSEPMVRLLRCRQVCNYAPAIDLSVSKTTKLDAFVELMQEISDNADRALIFENSTEMIDILTKELDKIGLKYLKITGDTDARLRAEYQNEFNKNDSKIDIMIGSSAMSTGLNLTGGESSKYGMYVVHYSDDFSPSQMSQRVDRAHRIGTKGNVTVISFCVRNSVESRVREVLYSKDKISDQVLGDGSSDDVLLRMSASDMARLL